MQIFNFIGFLYLLILILNLCSTHSLSNFKSKKEVSVLILGAGISGISAAHHLQKEGIKVKIIEGRKRPFGRVKTESQTFGFPVDHGAIWVDFTMTENPFEQYMKDFKTELVPVDTSHIIGFDRDDKQYANMITENEEIFNKFDKFVEEKFVPETRTGEDYLRQFAKDNKLSDRDYFAILDNLNLHREEYIIKPNEKLHYQMNNIFDFHKSKGFHMLPKGYGEFFSNFLKDLKIQYDTKIDKVTHDKEKVKFIDSSGKTYVADYAVVTAPIGVLKNNLIEFEPDLSKTKRDLIKKIKILQINKVMVEFEEKFWGNEFIIHLQDKEAPIYMGINFHKVNGKNIIIFIVNDTYNYELSSKSVGEVREYVLKKMIRCYPGKNVIIKNVLKTNWSHTAFSFGAFTADSAFENNSVSEFAQSEGRVFFAGEHTAIRNASTQGAWISGRERAKDIISQINLKNKK